MFTVRVRSSQTSGWAIRHCTSWKIWSKSNRRCLHITLCGYKEEIKKAWKQTNMSQSMSVKLFMICTGTRKTGNCQVAFVYYVLFIFCVKFQSQFCFQSWTNSPAQVSYFICQTPTHYQWHLIIPVLKGWWQNKREHRSCRKGFNCIWDHILF